MAKRQRSAVSCHGSGFSNVALPALSLSKGRATRDLAPLVRGLALMLGLIGCAGGQAAPPKEFNGQQALGYVSAQLAFGPRIPNTPPHEAMLRWLDSMSRARADTVVLQRWKHRTLTGDSIALTNVIARFNVAATTRVLYLAHWDTRPRSNGNTKDTLAPVPGANDGGSGVAVLLGVMDALKKQRPAVGVDILFVDGEDYGLFVNDNHDVLLGSKYYAANPVAGRPDFAVLFDMVGDRNLQLKVEDNSEIAAADVVDLVWGTAEKMGFGSTFVRSTQGAVTDDHVPLISAGMRAVDLIDFTYPAWHTKDDTIDKVSAESLGIVGNVAVGVIRKVK